MNSLGASEHSISPGPFAIHCHLVPSAGMSESVFTDDTVPDDNLGVVCVEREELGFLEVLSISRGEGAFTYGKDQVCHSNADVMSGQNLTFFGRV